MKNLTPREQRPTKKANLASEDLLPQSLNSSFKSQSPCQAKSSFFSSPPNSLPSSQTSPTVAPPDSPMHILKLRPPRPPRSPQHPKLPTSPDNHDQLLHAASKPTSHGAWILTIIKTLPDSSKSTSKMSTAFPEDATA
jgi:hypothetical protein